LVSRLGAARFNETSLPSTEERSLDHHRCLTLQPGVHMAADEIALGKKEDD
jgi:hypothetical protein